MVDISFKDALRRLSKVSLLFSPFKSLIKYLIVFMILSLLTFISSCTSSGPSQNEKKFSLQYPQNTFVNKSITFTVQPLEPGLTNIRIKLKKEGNNVYEQSIPVQKYPYQVMYAFDTPGIYSLRVEGYSISDNKWYTEDGTITVFDVVPPIIEEVRILPERPYVGDEVLIQMKVKSQNPVVTYILDGKTTDGTWLTYNLTDKAGYVYKKLPPINNYGKVELFLKSVAYDMEESTKVSFEVNPVDREKPIINVFTKTFYPENSDISFEVKLYDDQALKDYQIEFDGEVVEEGLINGKTFEKAIRIGKKELGTHTLNIKVHDKEGNPAYYSKRIYVGSSALSFDVEVSPANLTAGSTAVIALVPLEKNVNFSKIVFFVDGKAIDTSISSGGNSARGFTLWDVEEGAHTITIYAESDDNRGGIAETIASVRDNNGPRFISLTANNVELRKDTPGYVFPGLVTFRIKVFDPGGINTGVKPRLLIKEDNFEGYYRDLVMEPEEISSDGKTVVFSVTTTVALGYYFITVMNVQDLSGNTMRDIGQFLVYAQ